MGFRFLIHGFVVLNGWVASGGRRIRRIKFAREEKECIRNNMTMAYDFLYHHRSLHYRHKEMKFADTEILFYDYIFCVLIIFNLSECLRECASIVTQNSMTLSSPKHFSPQLPFASPIRTYEKCLNILKERVSHKNAALLSSRQSLEQHT